jgi:hypothetical protein
MNLLPDDALEIVVRKACPASFPWLLLVDKRMRSTAIQIKFPERDDRYARLYFQNRLFRILTRAILRNDRTIALQYMHDHHWLTLIKHGYACCVAWLLDDNNEAIDIEAFKETCRHCHQDEIEILIERRLRTVRRGKRNLRVAIKAC